MRITMVAGAMVVLAAIHAGAVFAQLPPPNLPPPNAFKPIPNFTGNEAGLAFRSAINDRFSGVQPISPKVSSVPFASMPAEQDGFIIYCLDCQRTVPCSSGGTGAWAHGQQGQWSCNAPNLPAPALFQGQSGAQLNTLSGARGDGTDSISNFNINGQLNVAAFGAIASSSSVNATTVPGSATVTLSAAGDFQNSQLVAIAGAGPITTLAAPSGISIAPQAAPGCTSSANTGYTVQVTTVDGLEGESARSNPVTITNSNGSLGGCNWNVVSFSLVTNAAYYRVYSCLGASCTPHYAGPALGVPNARFADYGEFATSTLTAPASASAQTLLSKIVSGGGTTSLVLANAPAQRGTFTMTHDNSTAVKNALAQGGTSAALWLPPAVNRYQLPVPIALSGSQSIAGVCRTSDAPGATGSGFSWTGTSAASFMIKALDTQNAHLDCLSFEPNNNSGMIGLMIDGTNANPNGGAFHSRFENLEIAGAHTGIRWGGNFCASTSQPDCDSSNVTISDVDVHNILPATLPYGLVFLGTNVGDISVIDHLDCATVASNGACIESFNRNGSNCHVDNLNASLTPGAVAIDLQDGSGIEITSEEDEGGGATGYSIWRRGPSANALPTIIRNSALNANVSFDAAGWVLSEGNSSQSPTPVFQVNQPSANLIALDDVLWGSAGGCWTVGPNGGHILFQLCRNNGTGATVATGSFTSLVATLLTAGQAIVNGPNGLSIAPIAGGSWPQLFMTVPGSSHPNWLFACQNNVNNGCEITPSTTNGGSTYSSPSLTIGNGYIAAPQLVATQSVAQGGGLKHQRISGQTITDAVHALHTLTWSSAFADTNYTAWCSVYAPTVDSAHQYYIGGIVAKTASTLTIDAFGAGGSSTTSSAEFDCAAMHD